MQNKTKFAIGDRVRVIESKDTDIVTKLFFGKVGTIEMIEDCEYLIAEVTGGIFFAESELELIPSVKTLENLEVGDLIKNSAKEVKVLAVIAEGVYLLSQKDNRRVGSIYSAYELGELGYTLYTPPVTPEPEKTEREKLVEEYASKIYNDWPGVSVSDILTEFADKLLK